MLYAVMSTAVEAAATTRGLDLWWWFKAFLTVEVVTFIVGFFGMIMTWGDAFSATAGAAFITTSVGVLFAIVFFVVLSHNFG